LRLFGGDSGQQGRNDLKTWHLERRFGKQRTESEFIYDQADGRRL